mgnify:CR=1 FL=1
MRRYVWMVALGCGIAGLALGLSQGRWEKVLVWGQSLCASCVGLGG